MGDTTRGNTRTRWGGGLMKWIIVEGLSEDGKQKEYQVSDGEPYDGTDNKNERTMSYDFTDLQEAQELCNKLNKGEKK